jgi:hypothetical protein
MTAIPGFVEFRMKGSIDRSSVESQIGQLARDGFPLSEVPRFPTEIENHSTNRLTNLANLAYIQPNG